MNSLDRPMEFLAAAIFLLVGASKIFSYRHTKPRSLGAAEARTFPPYWCMAMIGLMEMAAALALISPTTLALAACALLAGTTGAACIFRHSRSESAAPTIALLLLVMFVICERTL